MSQPQDPYGNNPGPSGYPPPNYGAPPPPPQYNAPPPPPPGYGPPGGQPGGYGAPPPPPPPGGPGYGAPQGGYPPAGYGGPPGGQIGAPAAPFGFGDVAGWAWNKFTQNAVPLIVAALVYLLVSGGLQLVRIVTAPSPTPASYDPSTGTYTSGSSGSAATGLIISLLISLVVLAVSYYQSASFSSGALDIADGKPVEIGTFFKPRNFGGVVLTLVLISIPAAIGLVLCIIPGLLVLVLTMFAVPYVIDRNLSPIEAIKASIATVRANVGPAGAVAGVVALGFLASFVTCGLAGIVVAGFNTLAITYGYRKLSGGQVVEVAQPGYPPQGPPPGYQQGPPPGYPPGPPPQYS